MLKRPTKKGLQGRILSARIAKASRSAQLAAKTGRVVFFMIDSKGEVRLINKKGGGRKFVEERPRFVLDKISLEQHLDETQKLVKMRASTNDKTQVRKEIYRTVAVTADGINLHLPVRGKSIFDRAKDIMHVKDLLSS